MNENEKCDCDHAREFCNASSPDGWFCTRADGHEGNHTACGMNHLLATWPNCTCEHGQSCCLNVSPDGYLCSRLNGHKGAHIACGGYGNHNLVTWPNELTEEKAD